jgi:hypothetical protein
MSVPGSFVIGGSHFCNSLRAVVCSVLFVETWLGAEGEHQELACLALFFSIEISRLISDHPGDKERSGVSLI